MTDTKEQALEKAKRKKEELSKDGYYTKDPIEENDHFTLFYHNGRGESWDTFPYAPQRQEFENGVLCIEMMHGEHFSSSIDCPHCKNGIIMNFKNPVIVKNEQRYNSDPVLERAFDYVCMLNNEDNDAILEQAKKELGK